MLTSISLVKRLVTGALLSTLLVSAVAGATEVEDRITQRLQSAVPGLQVQSMVPAKASGIYEVHTSNGEILYATDDGEYLFIGDMVKLEKSGFINLTEQTRTGQRRDIMDAFAQKGGLIQYVASGKQKAEIDVFTDIDCGYCRKLHGEMDELNALGITVNYYAYPRSGPDTESFRKYESVWCADNPKAAMDNAKSGKAVTSATCDNPVAEQYSLGRKIGITGTPAIVLQDGTLMPGYVPAQTLARGLGIL